MLTNRCVRRLNHFRCIQAVSVITLAIATGSTTAFAQAPAYTFQTIAGFAPGSPFWYAHALAVDGTGTIYVYDSSHFVIRKVTPLGQVSTFAGGPEQSGTADGTGTNARFGLGYGIAVNSAGNVYVADTVNATIRKITSGGVVTTLAGLARASGYIDGTGSAARFDWPRGIAGDSAGTVYVTDRSNTLRRITPDGVVSTLAGLAGATGHVDAVGGAARFSSAGALAVDASGNVYVLDASYIRKVTPDGTVSTLAEGFLSPKGFTIDGSGTLLISDNCQIRKVTSAGVVTTLAGLACSQIDSPSTTDIGSPDAIGAGLGGKVYCLYSSAPAATLRAVAPDGTVTTLLAGGGGEPGITDGIGQAARFYFPKGMAFDRGTIFAVDGMWLRTITPTGIARHIQLTDGTRGVATDAAGTPYVIVGCGIQKVTAGRGTDLAGATSSFWPGSCGAADGVGTAARFNNPVGIAVDASGNAYVADTGNHTIRRISPEGVVTTMAGAAGSTGIADGTGVSARFNSPSGIAVSTSGTVYVTDADNHTIRAITAAGVVSTFAGLAGSAGNADGMGGAARFNQPAGLAIDGSGTLFVTEAGNSAIRMITPSGEVMTIAGASGFVGTTDGGNDTALFSSPRAIAVDETGTLYIADTSNHTIRMGLVGLPIGPTIATDPVSQTARSGQTIEFTALATGRPQPGYQWQVSADGGASWANLTNTSPYTGATQPTLTVFGITGALNGLQYRCVASSLSGTATTAAATLRVNALTITPWALRFGATKAGADGDLTAVTPSQSVAVNFIGSAPTWIASADKAWVKITRGSGIGAGTFAIGIVNPDNIIGSSTALSATLTVSDAALGLNATILISLSVQMSGIGAAPFGVFDTPVNGATGLQGSFAVTGWALDDVGIDRVEIWRDPVAGETTPPYAGSGPGTGKIFIANGLFITGSRPDVAAIYPGYPFATRGGWGYLLLSYGLWAQGNGTYKLYAFAYDLEGQSTTLGTKTITVDNAHATRPFGALDTPTYGGTASGASWNYGWALTPNATPACTITNGNVSMSIDSGPLVPVAYGDLRTDIAAAFPGFSNGPNAGGSFLIDTTTISDGMHQIGWLVYDSCGRGDGVGSRFFTVQNAAAGDRRQPGLKPRPTQMPEASRLDVGRIFPPMRTALRRDLDDARRAESGRPGDQARDINPSQVPGAVAVRQLGGEWQSVAPSSVGWHVIEVAQDGRIEVQLPPTSGAGYAGGHVVGGERRALPLGSSLDATAGVFYWQPAAGFLGKYDLAFESPNADPVRVRVVVGPAMRAVIDTPSADSVVEQPFTLAGWALDLASTTGTGVDTVHVWAYPATGADPIFLGVAAFGGERPDVGRMFGEALADAAYGLTADSLPPDTYDIVIYPHRAKTNTFEGAQILRVMVR